MIVVKDMKMPKSCFQCDFYSNEYGCKLKFTEECNPSVEKPDDCPLVEIVTCKDCKYWKDSDGVYRRGIGAESKCPINIKEVFDGNFYCANGERRE